MKAANSLTEELLVDALDEALREIRLGKSIDRGTWLQTHSAVSEEGLPLLETLIFLSSAAGTWRGTESEQVGARSARTAAAERPLPEIIGRYQIRKLVGSGAMGDVFEGYDPQLDRRVAVKVPRCERLATDRAAFTERFIREARAAAAVRHAHICPVYDTGADQDQPYVVMAFVEGESLEAVLSRGRIEDLRRAVEIAAQVSEALDAIHRQKIIHRDLKPGNILIDQSGHALLTDFGLAVSSANTERLTTDGLIVGTPVYMSPEQAAGENSSLTPASDIYSLGAVFYEMVTGTVPFRGPMRELFHRIQSELPRPLTALRPEVAPALSEIALRAMAKSPSERFESAAEMNAALRGWLALGATQPIAAVPERQQTPNDLGKAPQRRGWSLGFLSLSVVATLGIAAYVWSPLRDDVEKAVRPNSQIAAVAHVSNTLPGPSAEGTLIGECAITISSDPERGPVTKSRLRIEERSAYPLRNGELVQFEVHLNRPAYVYLLWVDPQGSVTPVYPWDAEHFEGFDAPRVVGSDRPADHVLCPSRRNAGFEAVDPVGLQTFVLLARREPLAEGVDLKQVLANLPEGPQIDAQVAALQPQLRGIQPGRTKSLNHPLYDELESRLSPHFELVQMMTFPQVKE